MKNLKILFTSALIMIAAFAANAQDIDEFQEEDLLPETPAAKFGVSPFASYDYQFRYNTADEVNSSFMGVTAGAQAYMDFSKIFTLKAGLAYKCSFSGSTVAYYNLQKGDASIVEHSLELPITFGVKFPVGSHTMHIDIGPTGTFGMASTMTAKNNVLYYVDGTRYDMYDTGMAQRWNLYASGNFGFEVSEKVVVSAGYRYGFFNAGNDDNTIAIHCINAMVVINL